MDRADQVASSWRTHYDRLKLNTGRQFSHLPKRRYPSGTPTFPSRDQVVDYFERHAHGLDIRLNTDVERIEEHLPGWRLRTSTGDIDAEQVVVATAYASRKALVVGSGSSGMEIAHDLATGGAAKVWMAVRTAPNIMLRHGPAGLPGDVIASPLYHAPVWFADAISRFARKRTIGDLTAFGLPIPAEGVFARNARLGLAPTIVEMDVIDAIKDGSIEVVKVPELFDGDTVSLVDGRQVQPDVVICATGYTQGLEPIVGRLGVLDARGAPRVLAPGAAAEGLRFLGFLARPSLIGYVGKLSQRMATQIAAELS